MIRQPAGLKNGMGTAALCMKRIVGERRRAMLTSSFEKALVHAFRVHAGQKRKGSGDGETGH